MATALISPRRAATRQTARTGSNPWVEARQSMPAFDRAVAEATAERGALGAALRHHFSRPGKRIRAQLALVCGAALGVPRAEALGLAVACELLHDASLIHDDLQDCDATRRGQPAVWAQFGAPMAINVGDFLIARATQAASDIGASDGRGLALLRCFTARTLAVIRGQVDDNVMLGDSQLSVARYESIARAKTAPLLSLPIEGALILAGAPALFQELAREAMELLGTAYQIQDDLADLFGLKDRDEVAADLLAGRPCAPVVHFLETADPAEREAFLGFLSDGARPEEAEAWIRRLRSAPSTWATIGRARALQDVGRARLGDLPTVLAKALDFGAQLLGGPLVEIEEACAQETEIVLSRCIPPSRELAEARA